MNKPFFICALFLCICVLSSCARSSTKAKLSLEPARSFEVAYLRSTLSYRSAEHELSGAMYLRVQQDSIIWASLRPVMGIEILRGTATRDQVQYIQRLKGEYARYTYDQVGKKWGIPLKYEWIEQLLLGIAIVDTESPGPSGKAAGDSLTHLSQQVDALSLESWINSENRVQAQRISDPRGYQMDIRYIYRSDSSVNTGQITSYLPYKLEIIASSLPKKKRKELWSLSLRYEQIDLLSKKEGQFPFEVPKKYEDK